MRRAVVWWLGLLVSAVPAGVVAAPSSRDFSVDVRFGPWKPNNIDSGTFAPNATPYKALFGDQQSLMFEIGGDWIFWQGHGALSVGATAGFAQQVGRGIESGSGSTSSDSTVFNVIPTTLFVSYRWDYAASRWGIPLVPYVRGGLSYWVWWVLEQSGAVAEYNDDTALGGKLGVHVRPGIALQLDFIEPSAARNLDEFAGINHTYLFFEGNFQFVNGFGGGGLDLSAQTFAGGLLIEF